MNSTLPSALAITLIAAFGAACSSNSPTPSDDLNDNEGSSSTLPQCTDKTLRLESVEIQPDLLTLSEEQSGNDFEFSQGENIQLSVITTSSQIAQTDQTDCSPVAINPVDFNSSNWSLTVDKSISYDGSTHTPGIIPAGTNLKDYQVFDGSFFNVSVDLPSVNAVGSVNIGQDFQFDAGTYKLSFEWTTIENLPLTASATIEILP